MTVLTSRIHKEDIAPFYSFIQVRLDEEGTPSFDLKGFIRQATIRKANGFFISSTEDYEIEAFNCTLSDVEKEGFFYFEELIFLKDEDSINLRHPVSKYLIFQESEIFVNGERRDFYELKTSIVNGRIILEQKIVGLLKIRYRTAPVKGYILDPNGESFGILLKFNGGRRDFISLSLVENEQEEYASPQYYKKSNEINKNSDLEPVTIVVKDFCTEIPISGALVFLDNQYIGRTCRSGTVYAGELEKNKSYQVRVEHPEFVTNTEDDLENEILSLSDESNFSVEDSTWNFTLTCRPETPPKYIFDTSWMVKWLGCDGIERVERISIYPGNLADGF